MPSYPELLAGQTLTADLLTKMQPVYVRKVSPETRTNNTTMANDGELFVSLDAGLTYEISGVLFWSAASEYDMKVGLSVPSGGFAELQLYHLPSGSTGTGGPVSYPLMWAGHTAIFGGPEAGVANWKMSASYKGLVYSGSGGFFRWRWAQNVSGSVGSTMWSGSYIRAQRAFQ